MDGDRHVENQTVTEAGRLPSRQGRNLLQYKPVPPVSAFRCPNTRWKVIAYSVDRIHLSPARINTWGWQE